MKTYVYLWKYLAEFFLKWDVSDKFVEKTHFIFNNPLPPPSENRAVYGEMWKDMVESNRQQITT